MAESYKAGFIGCGNMGGALIRASVRTTDPGKICVTDQFMEKAQELSAACGVQAVSIETAAETSSFIFLGVKPQHMEHMLSQIREILENREDRFVLVTMAAGLTMEKIRSFSGNYPIIRIMPNLPASVNEGVILYDSLDTTEAEVDAFVNLLKKAGKLIPLPESQIDAGSAVSGCGPAFVCLFAEAMADAAVELGITRKNAYDLAYQTLLGTAKLLLETGQHPGELKDAVCSPGGTTIAGVMALEKGAFRSTVSDAVRQAYKKTLDLK
ncbi:MAG: pyrroline-5-carboxylate reductase [Lachnospiraceae bacterium]|nr:pyrroline-5-carboxylate reductase [Lachnospiraceae bacterium]